MQIPLAIRSGGLNWTSTGYHYQITRDERLRILSSANPQDPWDLIIKAVESAKVGEFSQAGKLVSLFHTKHTSNVAPSALIVMGDIGSQSDLGSLVEVMQTGPDGLRVFACQAARNSGCLWLVPHMLAAWEVCSGQDSHEQIGYAIADLLDPAGAVLDELGEVAEAGRLFDSTLSSGLPDEFRSLHESIKRRREPSPFREIVERRYAEILSTVQSEKSSVWGGKEFGLERFCRSFLTSITSDSFHLSQSPLTVVARQKLEATTGMDCSSWYANSRFVQGEAVHFLENILDSKLSLSFAEGNRYFFGHLLENK